MYAMSRSKTIQESMAEQSPDMLEFTRLSEEHFYDTVDSDDFRDKESDHIYECLHTKLRPVPFCDYLKRYIFLKAEMEGEYKEIGESTYREIIVGSFRENGVPASFAPTTAKINAVAKNWLAQNSVKRPAIFLLGFGLNMSASDVSSFLRKAQKESDFNFKDPTEIIYWYCFDKKLKYHKMLELKETFDSFPVSTKKGVHESRTWFLREKFKNSPNEIHFLNYLAEMKTDGKKHAHSVTIHGWFDILYSKCKEIISHELNLGTAEDYIDGNAHKQKVLTAQDTTERDFEKYLYVGTPENKDYNLLKMAASTLSKHFADKRLSRQRLADIISKQTPVDRFDLITLNFIVFAHDDTFKNSKSRYIAFIDNTNEILDECSMEKLYIANPYECFLLMCVVSDSPFDVFADVLSRSFEDN
jgi:hypothetical protein